MECKFIVGQKVVCINDSHTNEVFSIKKDCVYTVEEVFVSVWLGKPAILLKEIPEPNTSTFFIGGECFARGWLAEWFRAAIDFQALGRVSSNIKVDA